MTANSEKGLSSASPPLSRNASPTPSSSLSKGCVSASQLGTSNVGSRTAVCPQVSDTGNPSLESLRLQLAAISRQVEQMTNQQASASVHPQPIPKPMAEGQRRKHGVFPQIYTRPSLPSHLARFRLMLAAPLSLHPRTGFRFTIPASVDVEDLGFNSTVKDACWSLHGGASRQLKVPSAPPDSMLHITCSAHGHMKANDSKSHLTDARQIQHVHMDLNKIDRHMNIARVAKNVTDKMVSKWRRQYRESDFADIMSTYFKRANPTPRCMANLINIEGGGNPSANNGCECCVCAPL